MILTLTVPILLVPTLVNAALDLLVMEIPVQVSAFQTH